MPLNFKAPASSALVNATFVYKDADDDKKGRLGLFKINLADTDAVLNVQDFLNEIAANIGQNGESDGTANDYATNHIITNGENRKEAIEALDIGIKDNIDSIAIIENEIALGTEQLRQYISDSAYETANGAPSGGEVYYNTTTGLARYYDGLESEWKPIGAGGTGTQEVPVGAINGLNVDFNITNAPTNDESLMVFVNGLIVPIADWSYAAPTITLTIAPESGSDVYVFYLSDGSPAAPIISAGINNVVYHEVTAGEEVLKSFTIPSAPITENKTLVDIVGGSTQEYSVDFTLSGTTFNWSGLGLDGELTEGDVVRLQFFN